MAVIYRSGIANVKIPPAFRADKDGSNGTYNGAGATQTVDFVKTSSFAHDLFNGFSANGYTIPTGLGGLWVFQAHLTVQVPAGDTGKIYIRNHNSGEVFSETHYRNQGGSTENFTLSSYCLMNIAAGIKVGIGYSHATAGSYTIFGTKTQTVFQGFKYS